MMIAMMPLGDAGERSASASESAGRCQLCPQVHVRRQCVQTLGAAEERTDREGGGREWNSDSRTVRRTTWSPTVETRSTPLHRGRAELRPVHVRTRSAETERRPVRTGQHPLPLSWYGSHLFRKAAGFYLDILRADVPSLRRL